MMKRCAWSILLILTLLCGCSTGDHAAGGAEDDSPDALDVLGFNAAELVADIPTTQYFTDEPVAEEDIEKILLAGVNAPSAMNGQPWHFTAVTDAAVLQEIDNGMSFSGSPPSASGEEHTSDALIEGEAPLDSDVPSLLPPAEGEAPSVLPLSSSVKAGITDAPLAIVVSCKEGSELDAGLACQNMSVEARLLGYGTKILSSPAIALNGDRQAEFSELLGIPEGQAAAVILLVGIEDTSVDTTADGYTGATARNPFDDVVTRISP